MTIRSFSPVLPECQAPQKALKRLLLAISAVLLTFCVNADAARQRQNLQLLQGEVATFLKKYYSATDASKIDVDVGNLDPRLALAQCDKKLTMRFSDTNKSGGSVTVQAQCEGTQGWSLYVPAQVSLFRPLAVASRNLGRGEVISDGDIHIELVNTSQLRQGYLAAKENIIGQELKRPINKGESFRTSILDAPMVISRGDDVSIEVHAGTIAVSSSGTAMSNGRIGERIKVRNSQSDRIVSAEVVSAGKVITTL